MNGLLRLPADISGKPQTTVPPFHRYSKSTDKGNTWISISNSLPKNGTVHTIEQDFVNPDLLFVGTEFSVFFSVDGGKERVQLKSGIPSVAVRDLTIQRRENDLAVATFGRGFYILDDYTPLRNFKPGILEKNAYIFPVKDALLYIQSGGKYGQGSTYFSAKNPPYGATFTYYLKEGTKTKKQQRKEKEKNSMGSTLPLTVFQPKQVGKKFLRNLCL